MSVADKLLQINQVKKDIKEAIENKDIDLTGVDFSGYAEKIGEIPLPKEEQTKTVSSPNFSSGNVVVTPDAGKVLTQVTVVKDNDLVPENIVKDVNIFGVVGAAETGGVPLEQFVSFPTDATIGSGTGSLNHNQYRLLTFMSRNPYGWHADVDIKIYYKNESNEDVLLTNKIAGFDEFHFIVIPRSYGTLKIVMTLDPSEAFTMWGGFSGFYAKTAQPNVVTQLTEPDYDGVLLSYVDFDVLHVVYTAVGD